MNRRRGAFLALLAAMLFVGSVATVPAAADDSNMVVRAAKGKLKAAHIETSAGTRTLPTISSGTVSAAGKTPSGFDVDSAEVRADNTRDSGPSDSLGLTTKTLGCGDRTSEGNIRVNQDCTYRRQAEQMIRYNISNPANLVAGQNDSRLGFNHCGFDYSFDGGRTWGDGLPPFWQHLNNPAAAGVHTIAGGRGTLHTYDAASDPALATDADGRSFFSCVLFDLASDASAVLVTESPQGAGGSFYDNVPATGPRFVVAEDNSPTVVHDKEFIVADNFAGSPNKNNVYVTWTVFRFGTSCGAPPNGTLQYCSSPIYGSMSTDHANTWSKPEEISGSSPTLCFFANVLDPGRPPSACDFDQGSDPAVLPDGSLTVVFNNGNTAGSNPNAQQLAVTCHPSGSSTAGTASLHCGSPVKVGDDVVVGEPLCNFGRGPEECIPGAYIRTNDFPRIAVDRNNGHLYATWQDYRGGEYDIQLARSTDGGLTWDAASASVNPDTGRDHYFPAIDVATGGGEDGGGDHVGVSYFRTERVPGENTAGVVFAPGQPGVQQGSSDYTLAGGRGLATSYRDRRVSPSFRPPDGIQAGFNGDYSGLVIIGSTAHPIWSDTRNAAPPGQNGSAAAHDEDVFTDGVPLPDGGGQEGDHSG